MDFNELREKSGAVIAWTVHINFPLFEEFAERNLYYSSARNLDLGDGNIYLPIIESCRGRHQRDRGNDYAEFALLNPNHSTYQDFKDREDLIEKGYVIIRECVMIEDDFYLSEIRFTGYLTDFTQNDKNKLLEFTAFSDMSRPGYKQGGIVLTRERCRLEFNYQGLKDPEDDPCGWQVEQGGNPVNCTRYLKGIDGCEAHNNEHRIGLVSGLIDTPIQIVTSNTYPEGFNPTGFDYESRACFSSNTLVVMKDWKVKPINKVKVGDIILGFDIEDKDEIVETVVLKTFSHLIDGICIAEFEDAILETTYDHLFYVGNQLFAPVIGLEPLLGVNLAQGVDGTIQRGESKLIRLRRSVEEANVFNLHTESHNYIVCDRYQRFYYFVHNMKYEYGYLNNYQVV